ncbi:MAG: hypothetical protein ICV73_20225 [Acetobacteraceae bacterium]|nr:hypothetical protein [Acetobacteraceae bacterium]
MSANLNARLRRLEATGRGHVQPKGVLVLPAGMAMSDAAVDQLAAEHHRRAGWRGTMVLLPDNGREPAP